MPRGCLSVKLRVELEEKRGIVKESRHRTKPRPSIQLPSSRLKVVFIGATAVFCTSCIKASLINPTAALSSSSTGMGLVVSLIAPATGLQNGGEIVTITGFGFTPGSSVAFGATPCAPVQYVSSSQIKCHTQAHAAGQITVTVSNSDGATGSLSRGFTYVVSTRSTPGFGTASGGGIASSARAILQYSIGQGVQSSVQTSPSCVVISGVQGAVFNY